MKTNQNEIEYFEALRAANYNLIQKTQKLFEDLCDPSSIENYFLISFYNPNINMHTTILSKFSNLTFNYKFDCMNIIYNDIFNGSRTAMDNIAHIIFLEVFDSIHAAILYYELHKLEIEN